MAPGIVRVVMVEAGKNAVDNLLYYQFIITLPMLALPEYPFGMSFHILNVSLCMAVLLLSKADGEAGLYFFGFHNRTFYNSYTSVYLLFYAKIEGYVNCCARLRTKLFVAGIKVVFISVSRLLILSLQ